MGGCADEDHTGKDHSATVTIEEMGGLPLSLPWPQGGDTGDETAPEQLDWGSIEDKDGAFGQLTEARHIEDTDLTP